MTSTPLSNVIDARAFIEAWLQKYRTYEEVTVEELLDLAEEKDFLSETFFEDYGPRQRKSQLNRALYHWRNHVFDGLHITCRKDEQQKCWYTLEHIETATLVLRISDQVRNVAEFINRALQPNAMLKPNELREAAKAINAMAEALEREEKAA